MKKRQANPRGKYRKPVLYLDDIEELVEIVGAVSEGVEFLHEECEYESLDELVAGDIPRCINTLKIYGLPRYSAPMIEFDDGLFSGTTVSAPSNKDSSVAAFHRIDTVLKRCERVCFIDRSIRWWWYSNTFVIGLLVALGGLSHESLRLLVPVLSIYLIWTVLVMWRFSQKTKVFLCKKSEKTSFLQRKKDELILIVISVALTVMATVPLTLYIQSLTGPSVGSVGKMADSNSTSPGP